MPELPEVETIKVGLAKLIIGKQIVKLTFDNAKSYPNPSADTNQFLIGSQVKGVRRRAKVLIIDLTSSYSLVTHLKMTGQLVYIGANTRFAAGHPTDSLVGRLPDSSTRVVINFKDNSRLFFNDQRKFGWMRLIPTNQIDELKFFTKLGPEPLDKSFTWQVLKRRLQTRPKSIIKAALMDQSVVAGIGNIYADESLWGAKIHPASLTGSLNDNNIKNLHRSMIEILKLSIQKGGSTDRNYVSAEGKKGSYLSFARVFRKEGQACPRCGRAIVKTRLNGRGTHFCPHCQKPPKDQKLKLI